jgi:hypothetical protein
MLVFSLVVALSTFGQRTVRRYNNTNCTYRVNLQHEGSISELHCAKSFFVARARTVQFFLQRIITVLLVDVCIYSLVIDMIGHPSQWPGLDTFFPGGTTQPSQCMPCSLTKLPL